MIEMSLLRTKIVYFIASASILFSLPSYSYANLCVSAMPVMKRAFLDSSGNFSPDDQAELKLLNECLKEYPFCATVEDKKTGQYRIISGTTIGEVNSKGRNQSAASVIATIKAPKHGDVCFLIRYSGGSAAAWMTLAVAIDKNISNVLESRDVDINGEYLTPGQVLTELTKQKGKIK